MTRTEHLQWAKDRALAYVDAGQISNAFASMASDLRKHDELKGHEGINLGLMMSIGGQLSNAAAMRKFIEGFN